MPDRQDRPSWLDQPTDVFPQVRVARGRPRHQLGPGQQVGPADLRDAEPLTDPNGLPLLSGARGPSTGDAPGFGTGHTPGPGVSNGLGVQKGLGVQNGLGVHNGLGVSNGLGVQNGLGVANGLGVQNGPGGRHTLHDPSPDGPDSPNEQRGPDDPGNPGSLDSSDQQRDPNESNGLSGWKARIGWRGGLPPRRLLVPAAVLTLLLLTYLFDLLLTRGDIPRGTVVTGVDIGGLSKTAAAGKLRAAFEPLKDRPVPVRAGNDAHPIETNLQPVAAGLRVDYPATLAATGGQPLNPFTRLGSLFSTREREVVAQDDNGALSDALEAVGTLVHRDPTDGGVRFAGTVPTAVRPAPGADLDVPAAVAEVRREWLAGAPIVLPLRPTEPTGKITDATIQQTIDEVAKPAVSGDVRVVGDGRQAFLVASTVATALTFTPDGAGGLKPVLDLPKVQEVLRPQLASTERPGKDATVELVGDSPEVVSSTDGHGVDYPATLAGLLDVLKHPSVATSPDARRITAVYADLPAKLTTAQVHALGIKDLVSSFSTSGFAKESGENIKRAAAAINGKIVQPGETFSLNDATVPRDAAQGYIDAGIIQDGHPARGIGGGVSQLATTLYNAAYFAAMTDVAHKEHSYFISRYPPAREATVYEGAIDLKFRNDSPTGILIQTIWTPSSITVKFFGTKHFEVTSTQGDRTNPEDPQTITVPAGQPCNPSEGGPGFTTSDTRTLRNLETGEITSSTRRVKYKPSPKIVCAGGPVPYPSSTPAATPASSTPTSSTPTSSTPASSTPTTTASKPTTSTSPSR